jgi:hypothetical protein
VEVVPTAGGGAANAPATGRPTGQDAPDSAVAAAADAVGDSSGALAFGALILAVTFVLVGAAVWKRRSGRTQKPLGERHVPNG